MTWGMMVLLFGGGLTTGLAASLACLTILER